MDRFCNLSQHGITTECPCDCHAEALDPPFVLFNTMPPKRRIVDVASSELSNLFSTSCVSVVSCLSFVRVPLACFFALAIDGVCHPFCTAIANVRSCTDEAVLSSTLLRFEWVRGLELTLQCSSRSFYHFYSEATLLYFVFVHLFQFSTCRYCCE